MGCVVLHHPTLRGCTYKVWEPEHKNPGSQGGIRRVKMRPFNIDHNGYMQVTDEIWNRLQQGSAVGRLFEEFTLAGHIDDPPDLQVGGGASMMPTFERQCGDAIRQVAPQLQSYSIVPSTKYRPPIRLDK